MTRTNILDSVTPDPPSITGDTYNHSDVVSFLDRIHTRNVNIGFGVHQYAHGVTATAYGYLGAVYSPTQNRIYLMPYGQAEETTWHYIDCATGTIEAYLHGSTGIIDRAYYGGVYCPSNDRIYLVPYTQTQQSNWHYINCKTGALVAYTHGATALTEAYSGGVYSPNQDRIYLVPNNQSDQTNWHYIDCSSTGISVVAYEHGATVIDDAYAGGIYLPTQNRIYLIPNAQSSQSNWHYIDCSTGTVVAYAHGASGLGATDYGTGVYVPTQDRIYLIPAGRSDQANWHYIDVTSTGHEVISYSHGYGTSIVDLAFAGSIYSPITNRIYLTPYGIADESTWYYIDCTSTGHEVISYSPGSTATNLGYIGGCYSPQENKLYFTPLFHADQNNWHYIQEYCEEEVPISIYSIFPGF